MKPIQSVRAEAYAAFGVIVWFRSRQGGILGLVIGIRRQWFASPWEKTVDFRRYAIFVPSLYSFIYNLILVYKIRRYD